MSGCAGLLDGSKGRVLSPWIGRCRYRGDCSVATLAGERRTVTGQEAVDFYELTWTRSRGPLTPKVLICSLVVASDRPSTGSGLTGLPWVAGASDRGNCSAVAAQIGLATVVCLLATGRGLLPTGALGHADQGNCPDRGSIGR